MAPEPKLSKAKKVPERTTQGVHPNFILGLLSSHFQRTVPRENIFSIVKPCARTIVVSGVLSIEGSFSFLRVGSLPIITPSQV